MLPEVKNYLDDVRSHLHLDFLTEKRVIGELHSYFQERIEELQEKGISERDAIRAAIESFGRAKVVAQLTYEAYSKGSWYKAIASSIPHFIIAGLFVSHLWHHSIVAPIVFAFIVGITLFWWCKEKPNWLCSWVGYSLLPLLTTGFSLWFVIARIGPPFLGSPLKVLSLVCLLIFSLASLWLIVRTTIRVIRRDWLLASLMFVLLSIFGAWLYNIEQMGGLFQKDGLMLHQWDVPMASSLVLLGVTSATFIRLRQRVLKVGALILISSISLVMAGQHFWGGFGFLGLLAMSFCMLIFLLIPALVETRIGHGEQPEEAWWAGDWVQRPSTHDS
jgi:hypothetical protein